MDAHISRQRPSGVAYREWQGAIHFAHDSHQLMDLVRSYLASWQPEQLDRLPEGIGAPAVETSDELMTRAFLARCAELRDSIDDEDHELLREMALTLAAASTRLRILNSLEGRH